MQKQNLPDTLRTVANRFPENLLAGQIQDIPRISFNISIAIEAAKPKSHDTLEICDVGGGIGLFSVGCAAYGMKRVVLLDDFDDSVNHQVGSSILDLHKSYGVEVMTRNVVEQGLDDSMGTFDIITSFDSMEHWHHSPKKLFKQILSRLKPGGVFVLGVPNCVNLRKRITVPLGFGKWSAMQDWYEPEKFRGHVREPDVSDLMYIARDMALTDIKIYGRNWAGHHSASKLIRTVTKIIDYPMMLRPSLCSDIYLVGRKP